MTVSFGFYNSVGGDRKYDAIHMSRMFDGILTDGVFIKVGEKFNITAAGGMVVNIGTGRAWFNNTWTYNDSVLSLSLGVADITLDRIDTVILEVDSTDEVRINSIKIIQGVNASDPVPTPPIRDVELNQYVLGYVNVNAGVELIGPSDITNVVGQEQTPWVRGLLDEEAIADLAIPAGLISMWGGLIENIPLGWGLCDGTNGTPNLVDRFIMGAITDGGMNKNGGANSISLSVNELPEHKHTVSITSAGAHTHTYNDVAGNEGAWTGGTRVLKTPASVSTGSSGSHTHGTTVSNTGSGSAHENRPAYYTLAYIVKL